MDHTLFSSNIPSNKEFLSRLKKLAQEQQRLEAQNLFPKWMAHWNFFIASHSFIVLLFLSFLLSMALFLWKFMFFYELAKKLV